MHCTHSWGHQKHFAHQRHPDHRIILFTDPMSQKDPHGKTGKMPLNLQSLSVSCSPFLQFGASSCGAGLQKGGKTSQVGHPWMAIILLQYERSVLPLQTDLFARLVLKCIKGNHLLIIIVASTKVCKKLISKPANHGIEIMLQCSLTHLPSF